MIKIQDLNFIIKKKILNNINLSIKKNSITQIFGPNGAGKTTLFKIISGILTDYSGNVIFEGKNIKKFSVKEMSRHITFLPQFHYIALPVRVKDILFAGRYPYSNLFETYTENDKNIVYKIVNEFGIEELLNRNAMTLSGGEIKKIMLASAFIQNVPVILLDEPFISLDPESALKLKKMIIKINKSGKTIIIVSHRMELLFPIITDYIAINNGNLIYSGIKKFDSEIFNKTLGINYKLTKNKNKDFIYIYE